MILAVQKLRDMAKGGALLAKWTIGYYVATTVVAIVHSVIATSLGWRRLMTVMSADQLAIAEDDQESIEEKKDVKIHAVVVDMFESLIPDNVVASLAENSLLAVLVTSIVVGYLIKGPNSSVLRATVEIERIVMVIITFLIKCAPIGVFFLILPNFFKLDVESVGQNLGVLMGACLTGIFFHLFVVLPIIFFSFTRKNPYTYWVKNAPAWVTAWGSASSAGTLPVTMKCAQARGIPVTIQKFALPLGALINMDG
jgi:Na+/H+-dicarboxylate symporter